MPQDLYGRNLFRGTKCMVEWCQQHLNPPVLGPDGHAALIAAKNRVVHEATDAGRLIEEPEIRATLRDALDALQQEEEPT